MLTLWPWHASLQHFDQEQLEIIRQGEVEYWDIGSQQSASARGFPASATINSKNHK